MTYSMSSDESETVKGLCKVCEGAAAGIYFGALVCLPCKSFYIRCTKEGAKLRCQQDPTACSVNKGRFKCQACRFQACVDAGMQRKEEKPEKIDAPVGSTLCKVCGDLANGIHFGVTSCEGCKKFFRRGLMEWQNYVCKESGNCPINPRTRNLCRYCRYQACIKVGMSREAIKVGRPPSKKENTRHHPYGQINLSTSHHETSPKLYTNGNGLIKQEVSWDTHNLASLPALIHGNGHSHFSSHHPDKKPADHQVSQDLSISGTSLDINDMLFQYLDPHNDMLPLPAHFDLEETFAQIDGLPYEPRLSQKPARLQRIENLPKCNPQSNSHAALALATQNRNNLILKPIKPENGHAYRESVQMYTHPSPPYESNFDTLNGVQSTHSNYNIGRNPTNKQLAFQKSVLSHSSNHTERYNTINQSTGFSQAGYHLSPGQNIYDPQINHVNSAESQPSPYTQLNQHFHDLKQQQQVYDRNHMTKDVNPYSQQNPSEYSPYSQTSSSASPQSSYNGTSGYTTDSYDFLDEFSIYDPIDIRQVNHKYMPSCSYEPLVFNEEALTVEDLWSKKSNETEKAGDESSNKSNESVSKSAGSGMFKHMKSIDDKISQDYWFKHELPDISFDDELKKEMKNLTQGWIKCKQHISNGMRVSSSDEKDSHWPNVKENAPLQLKMWEFIKTRLLRGTTAQVMFFQQIKGSDQVPESDQKTLVSTASFSNCLLMNVLYWWDEEKDQCKYFWSWKVPPTDPFYVFRQTLMKYSRAIKDLNFDENEIMLVSALTLFSSDILQLENKETIEKERKLLVNICAAYFTGKYKDKSQSRMNKLLSMVPALRYLSIWHRDLMAFAKTFGSAGLNLEKMKISES